MKVFDCLDLTGNDPGLKIGNHSVWIPASGIKVPFQFGGRIQKYKHPLEAAYSLYSLQNEVTMLRALAAAQLAPPIGDWVYFKTVISEHLGYWWADPLGAYGYEVMDARALPPGKASVDVLRAFPWSEKIMGSQGAWSDLGVPERQNILNGYVVDVRRSGFDMLQWRDPETPMPRYREESQALRERIAALGQFPFRARPEPYQEYFLDGAWVPAERETVARARLLEFRPLAGDTVVDLGCGYGSFLQVAALAGGRAVGMDAQPEYVALARDLARATALPICVRQTDLTDFARNLAMRQWLRQVAPTGPEHVLALSMTKHIGDGVLWWWVDQLQGRRTYLETNAVKPGKFPLREGVEFRGGRKIGESQDRNTRHLYLIDRAAPC